MQAKRKQARSESHGLWPVIGRSRGGSHTPRDPCALGVWTATEARCMGLRPVVPESSPLAAAVWRATQSITRRAFGLKELRGLSHPAPDMYGAWLSKPAPARMHYIR